MTAHQQVSEALTGEEKDAGPAGKDEDRRVGFHGALGARGPVFWLVSLLAFSMSLFHMGQTQFHLVSTDQFKVAHLLTAIVLAFLIACGRSSGPSRPVRRVLLAMLAAISVIILVYVLVEYDAIIGSRAYNPNFADMIMALGLLIVALLAAYLQWGITIPILAGIGLAYALYGYLFDSDLFWHAGVEPLRLLSFVSFPGFQGLLGGLTELSAGTVFLFMLYASVLQATGGIALIMRLARSVGARNASTPAQMAVVGSGLMGMISGSTVANIASTGAVTIPLMKRYGFSANFAGAVEAVASMGGQVTPPVMGLAAFLLVAMSGTPYLSVIEAAALPALVYYLYLVLAVRIRANALNLNRRVRNVGQEAVTEDTGSGEFGHMGNSHRAIAYIHNGQVVLGLVVLIALLLRGMPPAYSALYSIFVLLALDSLRRLWIHRSDLSAGLKEIWSTTWSALVDGAISGAQIATIVAVCGILVDTLAVTGFEQKLSLSILQIADGNLFLLLIVSAASCMIFGLGLPTSAAYIVVALLGAPALVETGVPVLAAHFFVLYFANVSSLTPPVAIAAMVAAKVAGGSFLKTTFIAMRLGLPGFLLPFVFVTHPQILGIDAHMGEPVLYAAVTLIGIATLNVAIEGCWVAPLHILERALLVPASILILLPDWTLTGVGAALMLPSAVLQLCAFIRKRQMPRQSVLAEIGE